LTTAPQTHVPCNALTNKATDRLKKEQWNGSACGTGWGTWV